VSVKESKNDTIKRLVRENNRLQDDLAILRRRQRNMRVVEVERVVHVNQSSNPALLRVSADLYQTKKLLDWHRRMESILKKANLELRKDLTHKKHRSIDPAYIVAVCKAITGETSE